MASPHGIVEAGYKISEDPSPWAVLGGEKNLNGSGNKKPSSTPSWERLYLGSPKQL